MTNLFLSSAPIKARDERIIPFSPEQIWAVLADIPASPRWWPPSVKLTVLSLSPGIVGSEMQIHPRGGRPFRCRIEAITPPQRMLMRYGNGFVTGTGEWRLEAEGGGSRVTYDIDVIATGWMAWLLGKLLPLGRIHSREMAKILEALEQETRSRSLGSRTA